MVEKSKRDEIIELVNKLFMYTDDQEWDTLKQEVFTPFVVFDMSSLGGNPPEKVSSTSIVENWKNGFEGLDAVYHQAGNHVVIFKDESHAEISCYAIAVHFRKSAAKGNTREFYGSYNIVCVLTDLGWRVSGLQYKVRFITGNTTLQ